MNYEDIQAVNWSTLKHLTISPRLLKFRESKPREDTTALAFGRALHCCYLEPEVWRARYVAEPDFGDMRTNKAKAAAVAWKLTIPADAITLSEEDFALVVRCSEAIAGHKEAARMLAGGRHEEIVQWTDAETGIKCKARLDNIRPRDISDIKSTRRDTPRAFLRDASTLLYHGQLAWYHDGATEAGLLSVDAELPGVVAVQTTEPYDVMPFRFTPEAIYKGRTLWKSLLKRYAECQAAAWWPGVAPGVLPYEVTPWAETGEEPEQREGGF